MSVGFVPVSWTRSKIVYDAVLVGAVALFLSAFQMGAMRAGEATTPTDGGSLVIRLYGECAFVLLTLALAIGPLARLDRRFLPLLYNRRHLGVLTFAVAAAHVWATLDWYFAFSPTEPWTAMLSADAGVGGPLVLPFVPFGLAAFVILAVMAATSHDFWLHFLGPSLWKGLHVAVYGAYALVTAHLVFGPLQGAQGLALPLLASGSAALLIGLHLAAALKDARQRRAELAEAATDLIPVPEAHTIAVGRARILRPPGGEPVAIFNDGGQLYAISHVCAHQNGPLGEGKLIDGCVVCPWHGYEYRLADGCAPAPFTERVQTYRLERRDGRVVLHRTPLPLGARATPLVLAEVPHV
jgi:nitrite reductase/ring-hydroxylating ferredoxin subunit/DMSO/TMAO reductase YedYZ heme-binding membrane subunit